MNWEQVCASPHLQDLPFKIETSRYGHPQPTGTGVINRPSLF